MPGSLRVAWEVGREGQLLIIPAELLLVIPAKSQPVIPAQAG